MIAAGTFLPRVYLAGPSVFHPDAEEYGRKLQDKCLFAGLQGCFPLDNEITGATPRQIAEAIWRMNVDLIDLCHAMIADISPFRGPHMDPGTAWEIGYGVAKGLKVYAWTSDFTCLLERTRRHIGNDPSDRHALDSQGWAIEDFGLIENLMIALSASIYRTADEAIAACAADLRKNLR